ncbi:hypothetical protein [Meridianimarinicoccus aquatilis]|uniref:Component of SufBCD complex n=1 Tax=Meridianimarinicoccus aquatilis TaxID=2552766 RepID=A0A4R6B378_9RHOB|nr:hypothetical protein [Fluviibacterium aquatile]QIE42357.1 hypothetical protein G5B39_10685 [Rhodobacteraceae bacterium SC52]TDL91247.1 hypothetical protein E2L05_01320 [Fluviibacterium aquatile]
MATSIWDLIDVGSFSSLWFWLFLGVFWTRIMQAPMGVPVDLVHRAQGGSINAQTDLETLSGLKIHHELAMAGRPARIWRVGGWAFALGLLAGLSFIYGLELAQAGFALLFPCAAVRLLEARAARLMAHVPDMDALVRAHTVLRRQVQSIGIAAVFFTAIFGMLRVLSNAMQ